MIGTIVRDILQLDGSIIDLVGDRIYPISRPQGDLLPAITYFIVAATRDHHLTGASGLVQARVQIDVWAAGYDQASELADLVRMSLDGFQGVPGGCLVDSILLMDSSDESEPMVPGSQEQIAGRVRMDFRIAYHETPATPTGV